MSRIRSIHPGILTDEAFMSLTAEFPLAVALLLGLWMESDDSGTFEWKPLTLKARILPAALTEISAFLAVLERFDFIRKFEIDGKPFGVVRNFVKFQRPKKPLDSHPFTSESRTYAGFVNGKRPHSGTGRPPSEDNSEPVPPRIETGSVLSRQMKEEGGRKEEEEERILSISQKGNDELARASANGHSPSAPPKAEISQKADEFYAAYPKKVDPKAARAKFVSACRAGVAPDLIIAAARQFAEAHRTAGTDKQFIPAPAVWLNRGGYDSQDLPRARAPPQDEDPYVGDY